MTRVHTANDATAPDPSLSLSHVNLPLRPPPGSLSRSSPAPRPLRDPSQPVTPGPHDPRAHPAEGSVPPFPGERPLRRLLMTDTAILADQHEPWFAWMQCPDWDSSRQAGGSSPRPPRPPRCCAGVDCPFWKDLCLRRGARRSNVDRRAIYRGCSPCDASPAHDAAHRPPYLSSRAARARRLAVASRLTWHPLLLRPSLTTVQTPSSSLWYVHPRNFRLPSLA